MRYVVYVMQKSCAQAFTFVKKKSESSLIASESISIII